MEPRIYIPPGTAVETYKHTGAHVQQPNSEAHEADDRYFQASLARRLMLVHPAASHATNISPTCPNVSAAKNAHAPAPSTLTNYTARLAKAGVVLTNDTPRGVGEAAL